MPRLAMFARYEVEHGLSFSQVRNKGLHESSSCANDDAMDNLLSTGALAEMAGISKSYASDILNGKRPTLNRPLAIHIFRKTGWVHPSIAELTAKQIDTLEQVESWSPPLSRDETRAA